jgi:hypothetical protein
MSDLEEQQPGISRRTVAKAAAWSVPAIALAVSTPAYAASPGFITLTGDGCKLPGNATDVYKGYAFEAFISNTTNAAVTIAITDIDLNNADLGAVTVVALDSCTELGDTFVVPAGTEDLRVAILTQNAGNSANGTLVLTYTVNGVGDAVTAQADATPPIVGGGACTTFSAADKLCLASLAAA